MLFDLLWYRFLNSPSPTAPLTLVQTSVVGLVLLLLSPFMLQAQTWPHCAWAPWPLITNIYVPTIRSPYTHKYPHVLLYTQGAGPEYLNMGNSELARVSPYPGYSGLPSWWWGAQTLSACDSVHKFRNIIKLIDFNSINIHSCSINWHKCTCEYTCTYILNNRTNKPSKPSKRL